MRYYYNGKEITPGDAIRIMGEISFYKKVKNAYDGFKNDPQMVSFNWPDDKFEITREPKPVVELKLTREMVDDLLSATRSMECNELCRLGCSDRWQMLIDAIKDQMDRQEVGA